MKSISGDEAIGRNGKTHQLFQLFLLRIIAGSLLMGCGRGAKDSSLTKILQGHVLGTRGEGLRYQTERQVGVIKGSLSWP